MIKMKLFLPKFRMVKPQVLLGTMIILEMDILRGGQVGKVGNWIIT